MMKNRHQNELAKKNLRRAIKSATDQPAAFDTKKMAAIDKFGLGSPQKLFRHDAEARTAAEKDANESRIKKTTSVSRKKA